MKNTIKQLILPIMLNILSGSALGSFFFSNFIIGIVFVNIASVIYAFLIAEISNIDFKEIILKDAWTYLPFGILYLIHIRNFLNPFEYRNLFLIYYLKLFLIISSSSAALFLKIYFLRLSRHKLKEKAPRIFIAVLIIFATLFFYNFISREFSSGSVMDTFRNKIWNISRANFTIPSANDRQFIANIFCAHFMPVYLLLGLIFKIIPNFEFFYFLLALILSLGILPIYWFGKYYLKNEMIGALFSLVYFLHPALQFTLFYRPLWEDIFAMPLMLFILYFIFLDRKKWFFVFVLLFLSWKESFGIYVIFISLYVFFVMKKRSIGTGAFIVGSTWLLLGFIVSRYFNNWEPYNNSTFYQDTVLGFAKHPRLLLNFISQPKILLILFIYLLPLGFLPLLSPFTLGIGIPYFFIANIHPAHRHFFEVYHSLLLPFMIFASLLAIKKIIKWSGKWARYLIFAISGYVFCASVVFYCLINPFTYLPDHKNPEQFFSSQRNERVKALLKSIPENASVYASFPLYYYLPNHKELYYAPVSLLSERIKQRYTIKKYKYEEFRDADYIAFDVSGINDPENWAESSLLKSLLSNEDYGVSLFSEGIIIFKKGEKEKLVDLVKVKNPQIENKCDIIFNEVRLLGYNIDKKIALVGDLLHITYFWQCLEDVKRDYAVLTYFRRPYYSELKNISFPSYGLLATSYWKKGDIIKDEVSISLPRQIATNIYPFQIEVCLMENIRPVNNMPHGIEVFTRAWKELGMPDKLDINKSNLIGYLYLWPKYDIPMLNRK